MKRDPFYNDIKPIRPLLFWRRCRWCSMEFRREWGWSFTILILGYRKETRYICGGCAKTIDDVVLIKKRIPNAYA